MRTTKIYFSLFFCVIDEGSNIFLNNRFLLKVSGFVSVLPLHLTLTLTPLLFPGLIIHEGSSVYRIFKRWQAVNQKWKVLNYEKLKDLGDPVSLSSKSPGHVERNPHSYSVANSEQHVSRHVRTILQHHCGYTIFHILSQLRRNHLHNANQEVVMRVTTV